MRLSLIQISKGGLNKLKAQYLYVKAHIDEWVLVVPPGDEAIDWAKKHDIHVIVQDFLQPIEAKYIRQMRKHGLKVAEDYELFKFAEARNASLDGALGDYVLWLDDDDIPRGMDNLKKYIALHPDVDVFDAVYDYYRDEEGNPISDHTRERVFKNNGKFTWKGGKLGLIHETLLPMDELYEPAQHKIPEDIFRVEHNSDHIDESSVRNHIALLYEYLKTKGEDARTTYYLGVEFFNRGMFDESIKILWDYTRQSGWIEEKYMAYIKIADGYQMLEDYESAKNVYLKAIDELPHYPHAYLGIGELYHKQENWAKSTEFIMTGLQKKLPNTKYVTDQLRLTFFPAVYIALNYLQLHKPLKAYEWYGRARALNPKHPWVKQYKDLFSDAKDLNDYVTSFVKLGQLSQRLYPSTLPKLAEVIPDELKDQELLMDFRWRYAKPKIWPNKSIVFFCSHAFEDWGPETVAKGSGGSEEMVVLLSKELAAKDWDVTVYNNCIKETIVDKVKWVRFERFNPRDVFDVIVSWRNNLFTQDIIANKKIVDLHDVPEVKYYNEETTDGVKIFVKSEYHRSLLPDIPDEKFAIIPNAIDLNALKTDTAPVRNNMVWTSSYDRGVEYLLRMWKDIRAAVPDATLDIYYGWELYDSTPWGQKPDGKKWKARLQKLMNQEGVIDHGRVSKADVAEAYKKADIFPYPTDFPEISCISLMKAQAAGAIPVTSSYAAMPETNRGGIVIQGIGNDTLFQKRYKEALIELLQDEAQKKWLRANMDVSDYDIKAVVKAWIKELA